MTLYKNPPDSYKNWKKINPDRGYGQWGRFICSELICKNQSCERFNELISEKESFYHFCQLGLFQRMKLVMLAPGIKSLYKCPFCGERKGLEPATGNYKVIS